ncbi:MAG TPA: hypothetical protein VHF01_16630 [Candidatus Acidoferrum sp.]|nr:hypothetical protein [Candidatus Acidoferrum sp.]
MLFVTIPIMLVTLLALAGTLIFGRLSWEYFEKPLIQFGHRNEYSR